MAQSIEIEQLFSTMMQLGKLISQHAQESHEERTATMLQFSALHFLIENPEGTVSEVGEFLKLSKSSATQLIERLVKAAFVKRVEDAQDRRITRLHITEAGKTQANILKEKIMQKMGKIFSKIAKEDIKELIRIHNKLIDALKKESYE